MRNQSQQIEPAFRVADCRIRYCLLCTAYCLLSIAYCLTPTAYCVADEFEKSIKPILQDSCNTCHSTEKLEGELDLQRFRSASIVKQHTEIWEQVLHQLELGEMPPKDAKQLSSEQKTQLMEWVRKTL
ncbi:MAG: c-type cytochrome domain-containing protein, partial [Pirellulaceae bacterium]